MTQKLKEGMTEGSSAGRAGGFKALFLSFVGRVIDPWWRRGRLFLYYCAPCLFALAVVLGTNYRRVRAVEAEVLKQVCQQPQGQNTPNVPDAATHARLHKIIATVRSERLSDCGQQSAYVWKHFFEGWWRNALSVFCLTLLPFGIMGAGLARRYNSNGGGDSGSHARAHDNEKGEYLPLRKISHQEFFLKYLVGFIIGMGWLYTFYPRGQAASAINDWLAYANVFADDTAPSFFNLKDSPLKHLIAAFFGWYLYLLGYFFYRFYKSDVLGTRIYNLLFKKFLFVIGVALIVSSVAEGSKETMLLLFLIGIFPLSAVTMLAEFGSKRLSMGEDQTSLSILPGISTWQILRLEEEGVDSVSSLAATDAAALSLVISGEVISRGLLDGWIDRAQLIAVIGPKRWADINGVCETASEFVKKQGEKDVAFLANMAAKNILNTDEIAMILKRTFPQPE